MLVSTDVVYRHYLFSSLVRWSFHNRAEMIKVRSATISDIGDVIRVHHDAVHGTGPSSFYTQNILQSWSPGPTDEQRLHQLRLALEDKDKFHLVAELTENCTIVGFGTIVPSKGELRALYIDPSFAHRGIGSLILQNIEELALLHGAQELTLDSSLNAEKFYSRHGYSVRERGTHRLNTGVIMDCVKMTKKLCKQQSFNRIE